jgi:hypothetical protein
MAGCRAYAQHSLHFRGEKTTFPAEIRGRGATLMPIGRNECSLPSSKRARSLSTAHVAKTPHLRFRGLWGDGPVEISIITFYIGPKRSSNPYVPNSHTSRARLCHTGGLTDASNQNFLYLKDSGPPVVALQSACRPSSF